MLRAFAALTALTAGRLSSCGPSAGDQELEVDLPEHACEVMGVAGRRDWRVSLKRSAVHLLPVAK